MDLIPGRSKIGLDTQICLDELAVVPDILETNVPRYVELDCNPDRSGQQNSPVDVDRL